MSQTRSIIFTGPVHLDIVVDVIAKSGPHQISSISSHYLVTLHVGDIFVMVMRSHYRMLVTVSHK